MPRPLPLKGLTRETLRALARDGAPRLRSTAAVFTSMTALAATSLISGPALAGPLQTPCALKRTPAHHSEGVDSWNTSYPRPTRPLNAVMVFLSFPDARPATSPAELTADYFPATSRFFERASYGRFTLRPHPRADWIRMPHPSTAYAIQRDWSAARRSAYLRDALKASDRQIDFSRYDIVYFVADPDAPGVDSDATKVVNLDTPLRADGKDIRRVVTVFEKHPPDRLVLAHETGHVFDLPDLYHRPSGDRGDWDTYVGDWDLMGSQFGLSPDLFGWHKWKLGWLDPRQVACVAGRGSTRLSLEPLGTGPASAGGPSQGLPGVPVPEGGAARAVAGSKARTVVGSGALTVGAGAQAVGGDGRVVGSAGQFIGAGPPALGPGAQPFGSGRGTKLAVVRTGRDSALAFEVRASTGNDAGACTEGVLVYRIRSGAASGGGPVEVLDGHPRSEDCWDQSVYPPLADAPVSLGESYTVPGGHAKVEVENRTAAGSWVVKITTN
ncbi:M6 family metalloprotease domain-containing protein [Streptomyces sp. NPDC059785]|uniref:M6 family metalloprotease domain-containing protein n=1 Tax=unclassified Streptomyces TaxID=2593676 RepID=UPI0036468B66